MVLLKQAEYSVDYQHNAFSSEQAEVLLGLCPKVLINVLRFCLWCTAVLLDSSGEANNREEEAIQVEVLEHALNRMAVYAERDTGHTEIQTAAHNIICCQDVLIGRCHESRDPA